MNCENQESLDNASQGLWAFARITVLVYQRGTGKDPELWIKDSASSHLNHDPVS